MIKTKVLKINDIDDVNLIEAAEILKKGGVVAFPTETVYGLGANAMDEKAIEKIFIAKGRPADNPLIVHVASVEDLKKLVSDINEKSEKLIKNFCPGPLTLIFNIDKKVAKNVTSGLNTLAIRIPDNPIARKLIALSGLPIAAPSANISGKPSPTEGEHVIDDLYGKVDCIIVSEQSKVGLESTIIDMTSKPPMLLRPGKITIEEIENIIGIIQVDKFLEKKIDEEIKPKAPGMKYKHYSPEAEVIIISGEYEKKIEKIKELKKLYSDKKIGIMCSDELVKFFLDDIYISLGSKENLDDIATKLFASLRKFDDLGVDIVLAEDYDTKGMGKAVMNRLNKAAGFNIINV